MNAIRPTTMIREVDEDRPEAEQSNYLHIYISISFYNIILIFLKIKLTILTRFM